MAPGVAPPFGAMARTVVHMNLLISGACVVVGFPCAEGVAESVFRLAGLVSFLASLAAWFSQDAGRRAALFQAALAGSAVTSWIASKWWCYGAADWCFFALCEHALVLMSAAHFVGHGAPKHLLFTFAGSLAGFLCRDSSFWAHPLSVLPGAAWFTLLAVLATTVVFRAWTAGLWSSGGPPEGGSEFLKETPAVAADGLAAAQSRPSAAKPGGLSIIPGSTALGLNGIEAPDAFGVLPPKRAPSNTGGLSIIPDSTALDLNSSEAGEEPSELPTKPGPAKPGGLSIISGSTPLALDGGEGAPPPKPGPAKTGGLSFISGGTALDLNGNQVGRTSSGSNPMLSRESELSAPANPLICPFDDFVIHRKIGEGAFGKVYYATNTEGKPVAIKVMLWNPAQKSKAPPLKEALLSAELVHPYLVRGVKHCTVQYDDDGHQTHLDVDDVDLQMHFEVWLAQEWCDLGTLAAYCDRPRRGGVDLRQVYECMWDICAAGEYLHARGIVHGDLTGNNVLLKSSTSSSSDRGFICKICDFGLARVLEGSCQTLVTSQLGTVSHMPPELFALDKDSLRFTKKVDIYSLGMLLWQCVEGDYPFRGLTAPQIIISVSRGSRLKFAQEVPAAVVETFTSCTSSRPADRPPFDVLVQRFEALRDEEAN